MTDPKHEVMKGFESRVNLGKSEAEREEFRWQKPLGKCRSVAEANARRAEASRKLLGRKFYRGDCHSHTQHSDGIGTVAETAQMVEAAGLDFQWVTDHWGLTQAPECREHGLWIGQEPATEHHHLGVLSLDHTFTPNRVLEEDVKRVSDLGGTPFIPHPAGWWPRRVYTDEQKQSLRRLPSPFLMEVINAAGMVSTGFDYTDAAAIELWDELLNDGWQIHAMGNTDAHAPHQIGIVWNGVFASRCDEASILKALRAGRSFATEGPVLDLKVGRVGMGSRVRDRNEAGPLKVKVADAHGLVQVRLIADGKVRRRWHPDGETLVVHEQDLPANMKRYVRVEAIALDGRRGFSNPVYLR